MTALITAPRAVTRARLARAARVARVSPVKLAVLALLLAIIGLPMWYLVTGAFRAGDPFSPGAWTVGNFTALFRQPGLASLASNTAVFAGASTLFATVIGSVIAWLVARTDLPAPRLWQALTVGPVLIPALIVTVAWSILLSPRTGLVNFYLLRPVFGASLNVYSMTGMVLVQTMASVPLVYLLTVGAFRAIDPEFEHACRVAGAGRLRILRMTAGVVRPALLIALLVVLVSGLESIEVPLIYGQPAGISVLSSQIYQDMQVAYPPAWGSASAFSLLLVVVVVLLFLASSGLSRRSHRFVTVGGRGRRTGAGVHLGRWRWAAAAGCALVAVVSLVLPLLAVGYASIVPYVGVPSLTLLRTATGEHYTQVAHDPVIGRAVTNSLELGLAGGAVAVALCLLIAYHTVRSPSALSRANTGLSLVPLAVPRVAMAPAFLWAYLSVPAVGKALYGGLWLMGFAYLVMFLPIGTRLLGAQLLQLSSELEAAARVSGAGPVRTALRVTAPLLVPALLAAFFLAFVSFFREFTVSALMYHTGTEVFSVAMFNMFSDGNVGEVAALSVVFIAAVAVVLLVLALAAALVGRRLRPAAASEWSEQ